MDFLLEALRLSCEQLIGPQECQNDSVVLAVFVGMMAASSIMLGINTCRSLHTKCTQHFQKKVPTTGAPRFVDSPVYQPVKQHICPQAVVIQYKQAIKLPELERQVGIGLDELEADMQKKYKVKQQAKAEKEHNKNGSSIHSTNNNNKNLKMPTARFTRTMFMSVMGPAFIGVCRHSSKLHVADAEDITGRAFSQFEQEDGEAAEDQTESNFESANSGDSSPDNVSKPTIGIPTHATSFDIPFAKYGT